MFVCLCKSVTDHEIKSAVDQGVSCFAGMQERLEVSTVCGACECEVKQILKKKLDVEIDRRAVEVSTFAFA
jgi:bacterioferritin-associated ferredoxin